MSKRTLIILSSITIIIGFTSLIYYLRRQSSAGLEPTASQSAPRPPSTPTTAPTSTSDSSAKLKRLQEFEQAGIGLYDGKAPGALSQPELPKPTELSSVQTEPGQNQPRETELSSADTDSDGLTDNQELQLGTDINRADTDSDTLSDALEVNSYRTDPLKADSDEDSYSDAMEIQSGYNPRGQGKCVNPSCLP